MTVTINASTSSGLITTADNSGILGIQTAGTTALTIDASQNVGIRTTTAKTTLTVSGTGVTGLSETSFLWQHYQQAASSYTASAIESQISGASAYLVFKTNSNWTNGNASEAARIDSSGNLLVGLTSAAAGSGTTIKTTNNSFWTFKVNSGASTLPNGILIDYTGAAPNSGASEFIYCADTSAARMTVRSNGGIANYSANNVNLSDRREKTNFAPATSYLAKICAIPVQTFNYIDQNMEEDGGLTLGVVAQDVQAVAPELVTESNWASKDEEPKMRLSIYQTDLQYALMKCIQEQQAIIESLTQRITALEGAQA